MKKPTHFGKYLLLERLNVGGMAEVFIAKAFGVEGFERILAIKKILPTMAEDEEFITMFIDEARISVQLNHANIVHIHELGKYEQAFFIAMEYVPGRDVRTLLELYRRRREIMPTAQAVFIASKICEALDYAHRKKDARGQPLHIIHRDVSPQNILVSYEGEVKVIDFGIAKAANRSQKTQAGILKGKFGYMSPEQVRGMATDHRSDIFAMGVILYEMLTGEKLFVGESDYSTLEKVRHAEIPLPSQFTPDIPAALESVLLKALARDPEDRYQWASDLQEDLLRFLLAGEAIYSSKHLAGFMKEAFAEELLREAERMERFASIERPEQIETSGVTAYVERRQRKAPPSGEGAGVLGRRLEDAIAAAGAGSISGVSGTQVTDAAADRTQIVDAALRSEPGTEQTALRATPEEGGRRPRQPIVIGAGEAFSGATQIGPLPSETGEFRAPAGETRIGPEAVEEEEPEKTSVPPPRSRLETKREVKLPSEPLPMPPEITRVPAPPARFARRPLVLASSAVGVLLLAALVVFLVRPKARGGLMVNVRPAEGAEVYIDGLLVEAHSVAQLAPGPHQVKAGAPGHRFMEREVTVSPGAQPLVVTLDLEPEDGSGGATAGASPPAAAPGPSGANREPRTPATFVAIFAGPPGTEIFVEGTTAGTTPRARAEDLVVGRTYAFTAERAGAKPYEGHFKAERGGELKVSIPGESTRAASPVPPVDSPPARSAASTQRAPARAAAAQRSAPSTPARRGMLACSTKPAGAQVWVDGKNTGRETPIALGNPLHLPVGSRKVVFRLQGKQSQPVTVAIKENETARLLNVSIE